MQDHGPSRTAIGVAIRRAAHQTLDHPRIFEDPLALQILGEHASRVQRVERNSPTRALRLFVAARSRFAEDQLAAAVARGVRQYVLLGAGLDTFACRNPHSGLRVFEVDHPATQHWKRGQMEAARIGVPESVRYVPVDFEKQQLADELASAGFRRDRPAFFAWLGVVPYLTIEAFDAAVAFIASMPEGSGVVFDYGAEISKLNLVERAARHVLAARVAALGEPFRLFFDPKELRDRLERAGFGQIEDLGSEEFNARYSLEGDVRLKGRTGRLVCAKVTRS